MTSELEHLEGLGRQLGDGAAAAQAHLASEFDKHAGRARWDLARLADEMRAATEDERKGRSAADEVVLRIAGRAAELQWPVGSDLKR